MYLIFHPWSSMVEGEETQVCIIVIKLVILNLLLAKPVSY